MRHALALCLGVFTASAHAAPPDFDSTIPVSSIEHVFVDADGGIAAPQLVYDNSVLGAGSTYVTIGQTPRWHVGEPCRISIGSGHDVVIVKRITVSVGNTSGAVQTFDINVSLWDVFTSGAGFNQPVCSKLLYNFAIVNNAPINNNTGRLITVDLSGLPSGGVLMKDSEWFIELRYFVPNTSTPQASVSPLFNAGPDENGDGTPDGPTIGSSEDSYFRDINANNVLTANPNELRTFTSAPNLANLVIRLEAEFCSPCDADCNGTVNQFDIPQFVNLLAGASSACSPCAADTNSNGTTNQFDIIGFIDCLTR